MTASLTDKMIEDGYKIQASLPLKGKIIVVIKIHLKYAFPKFSDLL